mmetsp:Transcript_32097/g.101129  ORF Transcript_32097/g.101129 Transcript_32097/m.101129 type:complete len:233 (-) Transcript_32097:69-767(-)
MTPHTHARGPSLHRASAVGTWSPLAYAAPWPTPCQQPWTAVWSRRERSERHSGRHLARSTGAAHAAASRLCRADANCRRTSAHTIACSVSVQSVGSPLHGPRAKSVYARKSCTIEASRLCAMSDSVSPTACQSNDSAICSLSGSILKRAAQWSKPLAPSSSKRRENRGARCRPCARMMSFTGCELLKGSGNIVMSSCRQSSTPARHASVSATRRDSGDASIEQVTASTSVVR